MLFLAFCSVLGTLTWAFTYIARRLRADGQPTGRYPDTIQKSFLYSAVPALAAATAGWFLYDRCYTWVGFLQITVIAAGVLGAALIDLRFKIIPNILSLSLLIAGAVLHSISLIRACLDGGFSSAGKQLLFFYCIAAVVLIFVLLLVSRFAGGMGMGDIKLLGVLCFTGGIFLALSTFSLALLYGTLYAVFALLLRRKSMRDDVPFAPFIALGCLTAIALGLV